MTPNPELDLSAAVFVAIELSRQTWLVAIQMPGRQKPSQHKIRPLCGGTDCAAAVR